MATGNANMNRGLLKKITPECENLSKRSTMLNIIAVTLVIIAVILMIVALVYNYMPSADEAEKEKKTRIIGAMNITALVFITFTAIIGIWQIIVNKKVQSCITQPSQQ